MTLKFNRTRGLILALLLHVVIIGCLLAGSFGTEKESVKPKPHNAPPVMNATVIDHGKIKAEAKRLEDIENKKQADLEKRKQEALDAEKKRKAEEKKLKELKQQQKEQEKKQVEEEKARKKAEQVRVEKEKQRIATEKKKAEEQAKLDAEKLKKEQEEKRLEEERLKKEAEKKQKEEEEAKKAETEKKRKAEEARKKAEAEMKAKADAEAKQREDDARQLREAEMAAEEAALNKKTAGTYYGKIAGQVTREFNIRGFKPGLQCVLEIRMVPGGDVTSVKVIESSGDSRFDRAAEIAAKKASPLSVPSEKKIFDQYFRIVRFRFKPG